MSSSQYPAPLIVEPSGHWIGVDGNWSSFALEVGTPGQPFFVLPATGSNVIGVPLPEGCSGIESSQGVEDCGASRGVGSTSGPESIGFNTNASSTWDQIGLYALPVEPKLFDGEQNGLYGQESVTFGESQLVRIDDQAVAGTSSVEFWTGTYGLAAATAEFPELSQNVTSSLSSLKTASFTPSLSYGYTAGASYRNSQAKLVLGRFDEAAFQPNDLEFSADDGSLHVNLRSLVVTNSLVGTMAPPLNDSTLSMIIDSAYSDLWLPPAICGPLAQALNLTLDPATGRYLIDAATHSDLVGLNPEFTFALAANESSHRTLNIVLPYLAFDHQLLPPIYESAVPYFPMRQLPEGSDAILGRTFLQEAYVAVDWERGNFTLGQARTDDSPPSIIAILPPKDIAPVNASLSVGSIAGIVIGILAALMIVAVVLWYWRRSRSKKGQAGGQQTRNYGEKADTSLLPEHEKREPWPQDNMEPSELHGKDTGAHEMQGASLQELHGETARQQLMSEPVFELDSDFRPYELESRVKQGL